MKRRIMTLSNSRRQNSMVNRVTGVPDVYGNELMAASTRYAMQALRTDGEAL